MTMPSVVSRALLVTFAAVLLAGCAGGMPPSTPTPITSMKQLEGKWQGTITFGGGGQQLYWVTIHPDGSFVAEWGMNWQWGKITLAGGQGSFEMQGASTGTVKYWETPRGRSLTMTPNFGGWQVQVSPQ